MTETVGPVLWEAGKAGRQLRPTILWYLHARLTVWLRCLAFVRLVAAGLEKDSV